LRQPFGLGALYQPPHENPWTGALDRERSGDWNERIYAECYRPNTEKLTGRKTIAFQWLILRKAENG
jgi:hypothetical protein